MHAMADSHIYTFTLVNPFLSFRADKKALTPPYAGLFRQLFRFDNKYIG